MNHRRGPFVINWTFLLWLVILNGVTPSVSAGILFDNGNATGPDAGYLNSDPFTVIDNFALSAASTVDGIAWTQHDGSAIGYLGTDITIFDAFPSPASEIFSATFIASRTPNGSAPLFGVLNGYDYVVNGLGLNLAAGMYFIGIQTHFNNGAQSTWDETTGTGDSISGRYQLVPLRNVVPGSTPLFDANNALVTLPDQESAFQILGTSQTTPNADAASAPEPVALNVFCILLGTLCWRWRRRFKHQRFANG